MLSIIFTIKRLLLVAVLLTLSACAANQQSPPSGFATWHSYWNHVSGHGANNS